MDGSKPPDPTMWTVQKHYGVSISYVAAEVRENVITAVERMTGLEVVEVNIPVNDVRLPDDDTPEPARGACGRAMPQKLWPGPPRAEGAPATNAISWPGRRGSVV